MKKGTHHTEETRAKMSAVRRGRSKSPEHREAIRTGIQTFWSDPERHAAALRKTRATRLRRLLDLQMAGRL